MAEVKDIETQTTEEEKKEQINLDTFFEEYMTMQKKQTQLLLTCVAFIQKMQGAFGNKN